VTLTGAALTLGGALVAGTAALWAGLLALGEEAAVGEALHTLGDAPPMTVGARVPLHRALHVGRLALLVLGAVAAGVRLSTGTIVHCVWRGQPQPNHPDTDVALLGKAVPSWDEILEIAAEAQRLSGLGFAGVDISLDARNGPVVMEVNRRPGLEIQNANAAGLLRRLRMIEALRDGNVSLEERLLIVRQFDKDHWGLRPSRPAPPTSPASEPT